MLPVEAEEDRASLLAFDALLINFVLLPTNSEPRRNMVL